MVWKRNNRQFVIHQWYWDCNRIRHQPAPEQKIMNMETDECQLDLSNSAHNKPRKTHSRINTLPINQVQWYAAPTRYKATWRKLLVSLKHFANIIFAKEASMPSLKYCECCLGDIDSVLSYLNFAYDWLVVIMFLQAYHYEWRQSHQRSQLYPTSPIWTSARQKQAVPDSMVALHEQ